MRTLLPALIAAGCFGYWVRLFQEQWRDRNRLRSLNVGQSRLDRLRALGDRR